MTFNNDGGHSEFAALKMGGDGKFTTCLVMSSHAFVMPMAVLAACGTGS